MNDRLSAFRSRCLDWARVLIFVAILPLAHQISMSAGVGYNQAIDRHVSERIESGHHHGSSDDELRNIISEAIAVHGYDHPPSMIEFKSDAYSQAVVPALVLYVCLLFLLRAGWREALVFLAMASIFEMSISFSPTRFVGIALVVLVSLGARQGWRKDTGSR